MEEIEQEVIKLFKINLDYLQKNHPSVYEKVAILNQAISDGLYKERYSLEYINNYFDILEISSNKYLYNTNSIEHAKVMAQNVNYKKSESVIEGFYNIRNLSDEEVNLYNGNIDIDNNLFATAKLIHYNKQVTSKNDTMKDIFKFVFCGVGLGLHMPEIQKKIKASLLFIMEDNLELFRISLFTTNYELLSHKTQLFLSVLEDTNNLITFNEFFTQGYTHNHYIKYALLSKNDTPKIRQIQQSIVKSIYHIRPYSKHLKELLKTPEYLVENYRYLNMVDDYSKVSPFANTPILIIASGPSLEKNADWLKKNKNKFIIIAVLSSIKTLHTLGIKPDVIIHMDATESDIEFFNNIEIKDFFKQTLFLFSSVVSRKIIHLLPKKNIYLFETGSNYKKNASIPAAPSVGESTYAISLILGTKSIYLLGLDLALDPQTKSDHSKEHPYYREILEQKKEQEQYTSLVDTIFYVKGNFLPEVPITSVYHLSVQAFNNFSATFLKNNQKVYNLNNGAFLEGTIPLKTENISTQTLDILHKDKIMKNIHNFLNNISQNNMNLDDIKNFKKQITEAQRLFDLTKKLKDLKIEYSYTNFVNEFYAIYKELLNLNNEEKYDINTFFALYMQTIVSYIFDILNTKEIKKLQMHINNVRKIYLEQILKILNLYLITMNVYMEWVEEQAESKKTKD